MKSLCSAVASKLLRADGDTFSVSNPISYPLSVAVRESSKTKQEVSRVALHCFSPTPAHGNFSYRTVPEMGVADWDRILNPNRHFWNGGC
jgi:hypothetical protein